MRQSLDTSYMQLLIDCDDTSSLMPNGFIAFPSELAMSLSTQSVRRTETREGPRAS